MFLRVLSGRRSRSGVSSIAALYRAEMRWAMRSVRCERDEDLSDMLLRRRFAKSLSVGSREVMFVVHI